MTSATLTHQAYCGMNVPLGAGDIETMRAKAARILRRRRNAGFPCTKLGDGQWEIMEPEDCMMIPDQSGVMILTADWVDDEPEEDFDA